jgi:muramoyltetrapeptide carboxypeptidase
LELKKMTTPPYLKINDKVAIICMAGKAKLETIQPGIDLLTSWGLEVVVGETVGAEDGVFGGDDHLRKKDFQKQINDPEIKAVFSARGGYGSTRFLDKISWSKFKKNPKWVIGFSDITAVLCKINNLGIEAIHGPMPKMLAIEAGKYSATELRKTLFGFETTYAAKLNKYNRNGIANAQIVGGNLCLLAHSIGSKSEINTDGKILFIEDISEYFYNIDRMILQLKRAGKFKNLKGLIVGHFTDCTDSDNPFAANNPLEKTIADIIINHTKEFDFPIAFGIPIGHEAENWPIPCGRQVEFVVNPLQVLLDFR